MAPLKAESFSYAFHFILFYFLLEGLIVGSFFSKWECDLYRSFQFMKTLLEQSNWGVPWRSSFIYDHFIYISGIINLVLPAFGHPFLSIRYLLSLLFYLSFCYFLFVSLIENNLSWHLNLSYSFFLKMYLLFYHRAWTILTLTILCFA